MEKNYKIPNYIFASKNVRFLNFILDLLFLNILKNLIYFFAAFIPLKTNYNTLLDWFISFEMIDRYLFFSLLMFIYYSIFEIFSAKSPAKYITNTIVVMEDGSKPKPITILARSILRTVPFEYFTFFQGRKPGLHDEYSKTFVVKKDKFKQSLRDFNESIES